MTKKKKKMRITGEYIEEDDDRISSLSDDLIHKILSYVDTRLAVQTSILSNRWKLLWTTLPFLKLDGYSDYFSRKDVRFSKFIDNVFFNRDHQSHLLKLELNIKKGIASHFVEEYVNYAISHNVDDLHVDLCHHYSLSIFTSDRLRELKLTMRLGSERVFLSDGWNLPALTTLHLIWPHRIINYKLPLSILVCLPSLETLCLDHCNLPECFSLPNLRILRLARCDMPETVWYLPFLLSLEMDDVVFPTNMNEFFSALVRLQDLTLSFRKKNMQECFISCPQLVNLELRTSMTTTSTLTGNIVVMAPKLCNFSSVGIFPITCGVSKLENIYINLRGCFKHKSKVPWEKLKQYYQRFIFMFPGLCSAKILTLDLETIEALAAVSDFLAQFPSPFYNLKYVKLPKGYKEASLSSTIKGYLLGGSPRSTIVTTLPQCNVNPQMGLVSLTAQNVVLEEPVATATDTVDIRVQEEQVVENSGLDGIRVRQVNATVKNLSGQVPSAPVARAGNDQASTSRENNEFCFWQGHEVKSEFVSLLELIKKKYPETLEHYTTKFDIFYTMMINMFCITVTAFMNTPMTAVDAEMITEYRALFSDMQRWGFNISWLVRRLNYVEQLRFSQPLLHELHGIVSCIRELQTLHAEKMPEIQKALGTMDACLALHYIGDDLLPSP